MADQHKVVIVVFGKNPTELDAYFVLIKRAVRYAKRDGHNFNGQDANMAILAASVVMDGRINVGKEASIRVQADADAVDEQDGKASR